jgi:hypothetical protein
MDLFEFACSELDACFEAIAASVPKPQLVGEGRRKRYRYVEQSIEQALTLKLARQISCLRGAQVLLSQGFGQEVAILQRVLDENDHDVLFLCGPLLGGVHEERHDQFLEYFFQEEFSETGEQNTNRPMVRRDKIMAYNARTYPGMNPSDALNANQKVHKAYSGFVHGAAPHILDMYGGNPPRFHLQGYIGTYRQREHASDFLNYPYRALMTMTTAAIALKVESMRQRLYESSVSFGRASGLER